MRNIIKIIACFFLFSSIVSCGGFQKVDTRKVPISGPERAKQNIKEGRGVSLGSAISKSRSTNYEFSTSNPMWRATLDILDFLPLSTVDYSGGVIISESVKQIYAGPPVKEASRIPGYLPLTDRHVRPISPT